MKVVKEYIKLYKDLNPGVKTKQVKKTRRQMSV